MRGWIFAGALGLSAVAQASDWWYVTSGTDGSLVYADLSSRAVSGGVQKMWFVHVEKDGSSLKAFNAYRCLDKESATISWVKYGISGQHQGSAARPTEYTPAVPDTVGYTMMETACATSPRTFLRGWGRKVSDPIDDAKDVNNESGAGKINIQPATTLIFEN